MLVLVAIRNRKASLISFSVCLLLVLYMTFSYFILYLAMLLKVLIISSQFLEDFWNLLCIIFNHL